MAENKKLVELYTDGACSGNPGPGGYGFILKYKDKVKEGSAGFRKTTNNRMEMMALEAALKLLKEPVQLIIYTDSKYLLRGFEKGWVKKWQANGWRTQGRTTVANRDLWTSLVRLLKNHDYEFHWVKGHALNPDNNRCDALAVAAKTGKLGIDEGFEFEPRTKIQPMEQKDLF